MRYQDEDVAHVYNVYLFIYIRSTNQSIQLSTYLSIYIYMHVYDAPHVYIYRQIYI